MTSEKGPLLESKRAALTSLLQRAGSAVLAFSGGVDSAFLLKSMKMADMRVLAVTGRSEATPHQDILSARSLAEELGVEHLMIETEELANDAYAENSPDRCFHCKSELFGKLKAIAEENSVPFIFDGSNLDDLTDYRPGRRAADQFGVRSPLAECGFSKAEIREISKELGLRTWDRPSSPCLSSRFPYGRRITAGGLERIARAEECIRALGVRDLRVRDHGDTARIEAGEDDIPLLLKSGNRRLIIETLKSLGYLFVSLDLEGYRSGSMNRALGDQKM